MTQINRLKRAVLIVTLLSVFIVTICFTSSMSESAEIADAKNLNGVTGGHSNIFSDNRSYVERIWDNVIQGKEFNDVIEQVGFQKITAVNAPEWFEEEIAPVAVFESIFVNSETNVFELQMLGGGTQQNVMEQLNEYLTTRGWQCTKSDMAGVATFNKSEGECRWAMLECSQIGNECSIVMHLQLS